MNVPVLNVPVLNVPVLKAPMVSALETIILCTAFNVCFQIQLAPLQLGALAALKHLRLTGNQLTSVPAAWERGGALEKSGTTVDR